jgi:EmrB/QacA subfamily drug resistance transporter
MSTQGPARAGEHTAARWWVLSVVMLATFLATLDFTIVNVGLDDIARELGATLGIVEWVVLSYALAMSALLLGAGRLADIYGSRRLFLAGLLIFTLGSALCALSPTIGVLIAARVVQALGGALVQALGAGLVTAAFPARERGRAIGLVLMAASLGSITGPGIGGLLLTAFGWEALFAVNVPVGIAGFALARQALPADGAAKQVRFDVVGLLLLIPALVMLTLALTRAPYEGLGPAVLLLSFGGAGLAGLFLAWERRHAAPLLDLSLFRSRMFNRMLLLMTIGPLNYGWLLFLLPFAFRSLLGLDTIHVGLLILCMPLGYGLTAPLAGLLSDRVSPRLLMVAGLLLAAAGVLLQLEALLAQRAPLEVAWRMVLTGIGQGFYQTPNQNLLLGSVPRDRLGVVGGLLGTVRQLALSLGTALGGALYVGGRLAASARLGLPPEALPAQLAGVQLSMLTLACLVASGIAVALLAPLEAPARERAAAVVAE